MKLLGHHHLDELLVVDLAIAINVGLANHLIDFLVSELLAEIGHDVTELRRGDETLILWCLRIMNTLFLNVIQTKTKNQ